MLVSFLLLLLLWANGFVGWETFAQVQFESRYIEKLGFEVLMPVFDEEIKQKEGKEMIISGYHLPMRYDRETIILSKMPYASCFFCGGGVGQESIAEIQFKTKQRRFKPDEILKIRGKLKLNEMDFDHFVFILEEAELIE